MRRRELGEVTKKCADKLRQAERENLGPARSTARHSAIDASPRIRDSPAVMLMSAPGFAAVSWEGTTSGTGMARSMSSGRRWLLQTGRRGDARSGTGRVGRCARGATSAGIASVTR